VPCRVLFSSLLWLVQCRGQLGLSLFFFLLYLALFGDT
jgi:hypothetical protein